MRVAQIVADMDEIELRSEAVRRHRPGETAQSVGEALGRTDRWVQWAARADAAVAGEDWAQARSRAPKRSPNRTSDSRSALREGLSADLAVPAFSGAHGLQRQRFELVGEVA